ncbi:glycosyltransferase family 4 protein [Secundilactobacillus yichangensis]|uniref:glycosyltransferase family 4 protein n=1 Tax=Secundilactobacillus yichangensis TaxID=2799580 RepID=UPI001940750C|nr:glycosyltransferase family 4 protein [Secundilactobacillus yichangensis]
MKNILYLHAGAEMYGADKILLEIVQKLDKSKYDPIVILPENGELVDVLKNNRIRVSVMPYPIVRRKYFTIPGILKYIINYIHFAHQLAKFVRENKIELIHVNTTAVWEGVWLKTFTNAKIVWHVHEIITHPKIIRRVVAFLVQHFSDRVITVSNSTARNLTNEGLVNPQKIRVIHNGIDATGVISNVKKEYHKYGIQQNELIVGMVGRINSWKGQKDFLNAVRPELEKNKKVVAMIVGSPYKGEEKYLEQLEKQIHTFPTEIRNRVKLIPFQTNIEEIYQLLDIFVMPSTSPDPFPTVVLEAMANGIPIIGYNHGGVQEMVVQNESGILVEPRNIKLLSQAIDRLLQSPQTLQKYGENARIRQKQCFDLDEFVNQVQKVYDEIFL